MHRTTIISQVLLEKRSVIAPVEHTLPYSVYRAEPFGFLTFKVHIPAACHTVGVINANSFYQDCSLLCLIYLLSFEHLLPNIFFGVIVEYSHVVIPYTMIGLVVIAHAVYSITRKVVTVLNGQISASTASMRAVVAIARYWRP